MGNREYARLIAILKRSKSVRAMFSEIGQAGSTGVVVDYNPSTDVISFHSPTGDEWADYKV